MQSDSGYALKDLENSNNSNKRPKRPIPTCKSCQQKGHSTARSNKCSKYIGLQTTCNNIAASVPSSADDNALTDADVLEECNTLDAEPLQTHPNQMDTDEDLEALQAFMLSAAASPDDNSNVGIIQANL
jgi:hypothetical protein